MKQKAPDITRLVQNLARLSGRDPDTFQTTILDDGSVAVRNATTVVYYLPDGWMSKFNRHLHRGFFDAPASPALPLAQHGGWQWPGLRRLGG